MAAFFEAKNLRGMARWMHAQAREEWKHAMKIFEFIVARSGRVSLKAVDAPKAEWGSVLEVFEDAYKHECKVTGLIHGLVKLAEAESDFATQAFLQWFVTEQVEEEAQVEMIVERLKMTGETPGRHGHPRQRAGQARGAIDIVACRFVKSVRFQIQINFLMQKGSQPCLAW